MKPVITTKTKLMKTWVAKLRNSFQEDKKDLQNRKGSVMLVSLFSTLILSLFAGSLASLTSDEASLAYRNERSLRAFYLAEAGVADAYATLKDDFQNKDDSSLFPITSLSEGTFDATIIQANGRVVIESVGVVKGISRTVYVEVAFDDTPAAFDYALFSNKDGVIEGNPTIDGDVHSNEDWSINGNPIINGAVSTVGSIIINGNPDIDDLLVGVSPVEFPTFDFNYYYNLADPTDRYSGNQVWDGDQFLTPVNDVIYIDGDLEINGNLNLTGAIVVTGTITVNGNVNQVGVEGLPVMMSRDGQIIINGNVESGEGLFYSGADDVRIYGNLAAIGHVFAFDEIYVTGNLVFTASGDVPDGLIGSTGDGLTKLSFHE